MEHYKPKRSPERVLSSVDMVNLALPTKIEQIYPAQAPILI